MSEATSTIVENFGDNATRLLGYCVEHSDHPPHKAWSTLLAGGQPFQLMLCRRDGRVHAYSIGHDHATQEAFAALCHAVALAGLESRHWKTTELGDRYHIEFAVPA